MERIKGKFIASIVSGAIGDALGYAVEFSELEQIKEMYGENGITDLEIHHATNKAIISDDTQMTLFTADGLIWAYKRCSERGIGSYAGSGVYQSYLRWYYTQTKKMSSVKDMVWLESQPHEDEDSILNHTELFAQRAPGNTCLSALGSGEMGTIEQTINDSKGCGGVMRVAPVGLFLHHNPKEAFIVGAELAAITHGHPTGYLSAGALSVIIAEIINGKSILESTLSAIDILKSYPFHTETLTALQNAISLAESNEPPESAISKLGEGWIAEEALAIALYCALKETDFKQALVIAVNHDGDSDSTGAICGNIIGAYYGMEAVPEDWLEKIELKDYMISLSSKLFELSNEAFHS